MSNTVDAAVGSSAACAGNRTSPLSPLGGASSRLTRRQGFGMSGRQWRLAAACWTYLTLVSCGHRLAVTPVSAEIWNPRSGEFHWPAGKVTLPRGMSYHSLNPPYEARLSSPGTFLNIARSRLNIEFSAHECPGAKLWSEERPYENGARLQFEERAVEGGRVWIGRGDPHPGRRRPGGNWVLGAVTFPDAGCATFYLDSNSSKDAAVIDEIVRTFRPVGKTSSGPSR